MIDPQIRQSVTLEQATVIIGLEVHVQLDTASKLFCGCSTQFGAPPNTQTCAVCTGQPGSLPVLNRRALELAIKTGLALNCQIPEWTRWDRKNYFYPDLPKGYQTSQLDHPVCGPGYLDIADPLGAFEPLRVRIERAHLEEDAGKSIHDAGGGPSRIDLNRAGTPLLEIVTHPDLRSPEQAKAFLTELKLVLGYLGVSDCNMQQGSLRCDGNINLHLDVQGQTVATPIVEIKNMNSFRNAQRSLEYEVQRQLALWQENGLSQDAAPKQTRGWDDQRQQTVPQREKEVAADYRYFPDPDLVPIRIPVEQVRTIAASIDRLPQDARQVLRETWELGAYDAEVLVSQGLGVVDYFLEVATGCGQGKLAANWVGQEVLRHLNESQGTIEQYPVTAAALVELLKRVESRQLDQTRAKEVLDQMVAAGQNLEEACAALGIVAVGASEIEALCRQLMAENEGVVAQIREGNAKAVGALIGQARKINPNANPGLVRERLLELIGPA